MILNKLTVDLEERGAVP